MPDEPNTKTASGAPADVGRVSTIEEVVTVKYRCDLDGREFGRREDAEAHEARVRASLKPLTELMNDRMDPRYHGVLMTFEAMMSHHGWVAGADAACCGRPLDVVNWFGQTSSAECATCGKWAIDVTAPARVGGCLYSVDRAKYDVDDPVRWIVGQDVEPKR